MSPEKLRHLTEYCTRNGLQLTVWPANDRDGSTLCVVTVAQAGRKPHTAKHTPTRRPRHRPTDEHPS